MIALGACSDRTVKIYQANVPQYESFETFRATTFTMQAPQTLSRPGKIYSYNNLLLINDLMTGIHFYDNANPAAPVNLGFLPIHANADMAVRNDLLFVDNYTDLLAFNISNPSAPTLVCRLNDVFDFSNYGYISGLDNNFPTAEIDNSQGVVVGWKIDKTVEEVNSYYNNWDYADFGGSIQNGVANSNNLSSIGKAGSTARFALKDNILYTLETRELGVFDVNDCPVHLRDITLSRDGETLFPANNNLFIGTTTGMLIYDLSTASSPTFVSDYAHIRACDPVVVQGDKAFVTLSTGAGCGGWLNELHVIDIANIAQPTLIAIYGMTNPRGLGLDGNTLFLCDGPDGLKVFDKSNLTTIDQNLIHQFSNIVANDVIPMDGVLLMTSESGIYQYDYSDLNNIVQLSLIPR